MEKILIIGANGQLGTELSAALQKKYGQEAVIGSDIRKPQEENSIFELLDVLDGEALLSSIKKHKITQIYHLAAILSAKGEENPKQTWNINMNGLLNVLEIAQQEKLNKIYYPSSIAVFGTSTPSPAPQYTSMNPSTIYGISKRAGEQWCEYYFNKYNVDVRSLRYPGLISYKTLPGGGTTDYAVDIFYKAVEATKFSCFLEENTRLPMMYMPDAVRATLELMEAEKDKLSTHEGYNLNAFDCTPKELYEEIKKHIPTLEIEYKIDKLRQSIADSWSDTVDDSVARKDWNWQHQYDMESTTKDMLLHLKNKLTLQK
ncbi:NAD-dependent epimerase/dehydratase family protein [Bernardetia sp.]|uniref:NAD-dependent epimerase/dehydratase family protein n=1 Tax=Bernardetia sp. TaxID=1937974 RepID=UPI0025C4FA5E|nr:NAD-dependent epimerase/dehydratase family protein [Bernardetia sp.]